MKRTQAEKAKIVGDFNNSGQSVRQFCKRNRIAEQSLRNWIQKNNNGGITPKKGFVELQTINAAPPPLTVRYERNVDRLVTKSLIIRFPRNISIEVNPDTDSVLLERVLMIMGRLA